jgi:hypothetical protein
MEKPIFSQTNRIFKEPVGAIGYFAGKNTTAGCYSNFRQQLDQ